MHVWSSGDGFGKHFNSFLGALLEALGCVFCAQVWETNRRFFYFTYKNLELVSTAVVIENRHQKRFLELSGVAWAGGGVRKKSTLTSVTSIND